jgi:8-oxo-dGTP pyrophosphatase MutT (NUDIX family)/HEPN domain-containing protein
MQSHEAWLTIAREELLGAKTLLKVELFSTVTYLCQQSAEKSLKAYLSFKKSNLIKTHDLPKLVELCMVHDRTFEEIQDLAEPLNPFSTKFRYPTEEDIPELEDALLAIKQAKKIMTFVAKKISDPKAGQLDIFEKFYEMDIKDHRISAAGIVLHRKKVLLVRYSNPDGTTFLVGPGGGVKDGESLTQAIVREVKEETGIEVLPSKMLFVEDLESKSRRMVKIWFLCKFIGGKLIKTKAAAQEGIVDVNWYTKEQLENETVYPQILKEVDWKIFKRKTFELRYFGFVKADF